LKSSDYNPMALYTGYCTERYDTCADCIGTRPSALAVLSSAERWDYDASVSSQQRTFWRGV